MKRLSVGCAVAALAIAGAGGFAYGQERPEQPGSAGAARQQSDASRGGAADARTFINEMAIAGMAEVQLGKMATERAENPDVKAFGQMMVKDHSQANNELKQVASQLNAPMPTQLDQKHRDLAAKLSKLEGEAFDREYMTAMVQGHEEVASKLRMRATGPSASSQSSPGAPTASAGATGTTTGSQTRQGQTTTTGGGAAAGAVGTTGGAAGEQALNQWASKALPVVQQHLEHARELQQKVAGR